MNTQHEDEMAAFIRENYCVCDSHGIITKEKTNRVRAMLEQQKIDPAIPVQRLPEVNGVPNRKDHLQSVAQIPGLIKKYYPLIADDQALVHLSFINPLQLATDVLGISVTPAMAGFIRAKMRRIMSFTEVELPFDGKIGGINTIKWNLESLTKFEK